MSRNNNIKAPIPLRNKLLSDLNSVGSSIAPKRVPRCSSSADLKSLNKASPFPQHSQTPDPNTIVSNKENEKLLKERLQRYALDYPEDYEEYLAEITNENSKWFSRAKKRKLNLNKYLPYPTETHKDQAKYLSHVIVHLYIAIKSLDLEGLVSISTKDLVVIRHDSELALDTDFFNADLSFDVENNESGDEGDEEDDEVKSSGIIGKIMPRSATVVSVNHWTNELKSCLKMKIDLPLTLRASLARVYYSLVLSTGQSIQSSLFVQMFVKLTSKYGDLLSAEKRLVLNHQLILKFLSQFFPDPDSSYTTYNSQNSESDREMLTLYLKLTNHASRFFPKHAAREIFDWSLQRFSPSTASLSLSILNNCLPISIGGDNDVLRFLPSIFHIWTSAPSNKNLDLQLYELLGKISKEAYLKTTESFNHLKDFGVFTESQINFIFNKIQQNLRIEQKLNSFNGVAKILVYSLTSESFQLFSQKISVLLSSLETFAHPSNSGTWTTLLSRFCQRVLHRYHRRYREEQDESLKIPKAYKLNVSMNTDICNFFKDLVLLGSQSKIESAQNHFIACITYLCDIPSERGHELINRCLVDIYDSLTDQFVNSNHRIMVALKQFTEIARFMIKDPVYRVHVTDILMLLINKIGTNDLNLTNSVFNSLVTVASFVQFKNLSKENSFLTYESHTAYFVHEHIMFLKENPSIKFQAELEDATKAFIASTKIFKTIVSNLFEKFILLMEADINDKLLFKFTQSSLVFVECFSKELFDYYAELAFKKISSGDISNTFIHEPLLSNLIASIVKKDPTYSKKFFSELNRLIRHEVDQGAGTIRNKNSKVLASDKRLSLYLSNIGEVLSVSLGEVLKYSDEFLDLLGFLNKNITNPSLHGPISYIIHKTLKNLTNVKLRDNCVFQNNPSDNDFESCWGLNHDSVQRFEESNLQFEWYVPTIKEISFAVEIFETIVIESLSNIDRLMKENKLSDLTTIDEFDKNLLYLGHSLSGISILFDPDFNTEGLDEDFSKITLEKKLMILKSLRSLRSEDIELNIDIEQITKTDRDIQLHSPSPSDTDGEKEAGISFSKELEGLGEFPASNDDQCISSRVLTPSDPHDYDLTSVMNPAIAFRESKIYNCNYFFGSSLSEKKAYTSYNHLHSLRSLVGQGLHKLILYVTENTEQSVHLSQIILLTTRTYFCDVGKESTFDVDDQLFIDYTFLKKVQAIANYSKPFTRTALGARIEKYHRQRIILHSTNRFQTKLDKLLLKDIVKLSMSPYSAVFQPAQIVLIEAMKKLIGSYGLIISTALEDLEDSIKKKDFKKVQSGLKIFRLKKASKKILHDYKNIKKIIEIISGALRLNDSDTNKVAQKCFNDIAERLQIPSAVVLFDEEEIDLALRPPDKRIDLEVSTVKAAKDTKRQEYYQKIIDLQDYLIEQEKQNKHWKLTLLYLKLIVYLQEYYELPTRAQLINILAERSKSNHPVLVRMCTKAFSKLVNKTIAFATCEHSLRNTFDIEYLRVGTTEIEVSEGFNSRFFNEMKNTENPKFFIDGKCSDGWLFWGNKLKVLTAESIELKFDLKDKEILKSFGSIISKDWFVSIFNSLAEENEITGIFQPNDVSLIKAATTLIYLGYTDLKYDDLLELVTESFDKNDKAKVIICAEVICGLLNCSKYTNNKNLKKRDEFLNVFFKKVLGEDLTPDSSNVWNMVFWWLPLRVDFRRIPILLEFVESIGSVIDVDSNQAFIQSARISFTKSFIASVNYRYENYEKIMEMLPFSHPYELVRTQIGALMSTLQYAFFKEEYDNSQEFMSAQAGTELGSVNFGFPKPYSDMIIALLNQVQEANHKIQDLTTQEALKTKYHYLSSTLLKWLHFVIVGSFSAALVPLFKDHIAPFLLGLEQNRELCKLGDLNPSHYFKKIAEIPLRPEELSKVITIINVDEGFIHQLLLKLSFLEILFSRQLLQLSSKEKKKILSKVNKLLFHSSVEVRKRAGEVFTGIIHTSKDLELITPFIKKYTKALSKNMTKKNLSSQEIIQLHGATIGVGSLVSAFPYISPPPVWLPSHIITLVRATSINGVIGKSAKDFLSEFKKLRADTWHIDRKSFTEDQLADLEGVLWRSYFA